jgi:two-component system, chemotaxis family, protein-glutamate methylesterase/glutaminase
MDRIRVLVVEDSSTVRQRLVEVLSADPDLEVVGEAEDGKRGIELCTGLRPDVVTLDMMLPLLTGVAVTEYIMAYCPTPILIVSSSINRGELFKTYDALAAGAVDVLEKPAGDASDEAWEQRLLATVKLIARIKVITHPRGRLGAIGRSTDGSVRAPPPAPRASSPARVLAIGASTGGPAAVVDVLRSLSPSFPWPVLLVVHIGGPFGSAFADWLDSQSPLRSAYAREGEPLSAARGRVVMAPPGKHLILHDGRLRLTLGPERHSCRPSVDVLFESLAIDQGAAVVACLLTGMGRDGAAGLLAIRRAGGLTIAQDEKTSVVWGMPGEAVKLDAAERVLPLDDIGRTLAAMARAREAGGARP